MSELELQDSIIRHSLQILRLSAGEQAAVDEIMRQLEDELRRLLASDIGDATKREIEKLIADAEKLISPAYRAAGASIDTHALALIVAEHTVDLIKEISPSVKLPSEHTLASLTRDVMIDGAPTSAWWQKQAEDTAFKFAAQVRQGVINGETTDRIVQRITGKAGDPGLMVVPMHNARALVHSSILNAAAVARFESFKANQDIFIGVRWLSTLDTKTCLQCAAMDGATWDFEGKKIGGTTTDFRLPLAHWNCRCTLSAARRSTSGPNRRTSSLGRLEGDTSFDAFLDRMSPEQLDTYLGPGRAERYRSGKITLKDLVSGSGRPLTLAQLRAA